MTLSLSELHAHYLQWNEIIPFFILAFVCMFLSVLVLVAAAKVSAGKKHRQREHSLYMRGDEPDDRYNGTGYEDEAEYRSLRKLKWAERDEAERLTQSFYEMMFTDTCILGFIGVYVILDWFVTIPSVRNFWDSYSDFILLGLIILSCVVNSFLDHVFVNLRDIRRSEKASIRLIGMLYMGIIFLYIKFIYQDNNYDKIMVYYLSLMVGRFVYFDASFHDFRESVKKAFRNFPIMLLALADTAVMAAYGFQEGYLLKINGVVVSLMIAHLYMIVCIFIIAHTHIVEGMTRIPQDGFQQY